MSGKLLGKLAVQDSNQLKSIVLRRDYLSQMRTIADRGFLTEDERLVVLDRIKTDLEQIDNLYNRAWDEIIQKYSLKKGENSEFRLEFETGNIYLVDNTD